MGSNFSFTVGSEYFVNHCSRVYFSMLHNPYVAFDSIGHSDRK